MNPKTLRLRTTNCVIRQIQKQKQFIYFIFLHTEICHIVFILINLLHMQKLIRFIYNDGLDCIIKRKIV